MLKNNTFSTCINYSIHYTSDHFQSQAKNLENRILNHPILQSSLSLFILDIIFFCILCLGSPKSNWFLGNFLSIKLVPGQPKIKLGDLHILNIGKKIPFQCTTLLRQRDGGEIQHL